jgi:hypothetical protein
VFLELNNVINRATFVTEQARMPFRKLSQKDAHWNDVPEPFFPGIGFTRLGVPCYATSLLTNKLVYFVQFLEVKLTPSLSDLIFGRSMHSGSYFFREIALVISITYIQPLLCTGTSSNKVNDFPQP